MFIEGRYGFYFVMKYFLGGVCFFVRFVGCVYLVCSKLVEVDRFGGSVVSVSVS